MGRIMVLGHPLSKAATRASIAWCGGFCLLALIAGAVRLLPWLLDPSVPFRVVVPFARGLGELAVEASVLVGWPLGWALAAQRFAERGEARAMMLLGESPAKAALAQWKNALALSALLAIASFMGARDANAPGRMAQDLLNQGRAACANVTAPASFTVPFVSATWLCAPGVSPRLYGSGPGSLHAIAFTARDARIAGDMRRIELDDARFSVPLAAFPINVHAEAVALHGMSPWTHASNVPAFLRAFVVVIAAAFAAFVALGACATRLVRGTMSAVGVGVVGSLAMLGLMRAMERADAPAALYLATPIAAALAPAAFTALLVFIRVRRRA